MKTVYLSILLMILNHYSVLAKTAETNTIRLIPQPTEINIQNGTFKLPTSLTIASPKELKQEVSLLDEYLKELKIISKQSSEETKATILLKLSSTVLPKHQEGYLLRISNRNIEIESSTNKGIFMVFRL